MTAKHLMNFGRLSTVMRWFVALGVVDVGGLASNFV